ncbi:MAG: TetR/AcrR family transcriptional regulator [Mycobacterium sp.]
MTQGGLRKRPLQVRSRATTQRILDTASRLLVEVGYQAIVASPTLLLQESGVSRGSFYSFFETPEKVLEELAFQCMQESAALLGDMLEARPITHWHGVVDTLIEFYRDCFQRPLIRELWVGQNLTPPVRAADREWMQDVAKTLLVALEQFTPAFADFSLRQSVVAIEICERLFQYAYTDEVHGDQAIIEEIRIVLVQYLTHYAELDGSTGTKSTPSRARRKRR